MHAVNQIGKLLGQKTVAEFVYSESAIRKLSEIGIDYAQGNYLGSAQPVKQLLGEPQ